MQDDEAQGLCRRLGHSGERAHAQTLHFFQTEHLAADTRMLGQSLGRLGEMIWCRVVGGSVAPFTGQGHTGHLSLGQSEIGFHGRGTGHA